MKKTNPFETDAIRSGHFAVICSASVRPPQHPITLDNYLQNLEDVRRDLDKNNSAAVDTTVILDETPEITLKLAVTMKNQGALIAPNDDESPVDIGNLATPTSSLSLTKQNGLSLEASAVAEAEQIAQACARLSKGAIDVANTLVERAEREHLSIESASPTFAASPDENISRNAYCRARGPEQTLSFLGEERILGGGHAIPNQLYSKETFSLTQCRVAISHKNNRRYLKARVDDPEWLRLIRSFPMAVEELDGDLESDEMYLLRLAEASNQLVDVDVCLTEKVVTKKRRLVPLRVQNRAAIKDAINERLEVIEE